MSLKKQTSCISCTAIEVLAATLACVFIKKQKRRTLEHESAVTAETKASTT